MLEFRSAPLEFRVTDKNAGIVDALVNQMEVVDDYNSVFGEDVWDTAVAKSGKMPRVLVDHEGRVAGKVLETRKQRTGNGVFQRAQLQYNLKSQYGTEAFNDVAEGYYDEYSVGFVTNKQHVEKRDDKNVVVKDAVRWFEVSQVLAGASPGTMTIGVRSLLAQLRLPDLRAVADPRQEQFDCPYCNGMSGASTDPASCTCTAFCGAAVCPEPFDNDADDKVIVIGQTQMSLAFLLDYRADTVTNAHDTPPKGKPADSSQYGDPANYKYPLDSDARIHAAIAYFNHSGQQAAGGYSDSQWSAIGGRIASAANKAFGPGHHFAGGKIATPDATTSKMSALASGTETTSAPDTSEIREIPPEGPEEDIASFRDELKHLGIEV